jgi:hypothetical protein
MHFRHNISDLQPFSHNSNQQIPTSICVISSTVHLLAEDSIVSKINLSNRALLTLTTSEKPHFFRNSSLKGFGVKVNSTGILSFIAEVSYGGQSSRTTLGTYPVAS